MRPSERKLLDDGRSALLTYKFQYLTSATVPDDPEIRISLGQLGPSDSVGFFNVIVHDNQREQHISHDTTTCLVRT